MEQTDHHQFAIDALKFALTLAVASLHEPVTNSVWVKRRRHFHRLLWLLEYLDPTAGSHFERWRGVEPLSPEGYVRGRRR